jgi:hypothetical protein
VLATSGTVHDDARLRRAQAYATVNGVGLEIARYLLMEKIQGRAEILRTHFGDADTLARIEKLTTKLRFAATIEGCPAVTPSGLTRGWPGMPGDASGCAVRPGTGPAG